MISRIHEQIAHLNLDIENSRINISLLKKQIDKIESELIHSLLTKEKLEEQLRVMLLSCVVKK